MSVIVIIPGPLRAFAEGQQEIVIDQPAATVAHVLTALWEDIPGMRDRCLNSKIRGHINIFVGHKDIRLARELRRQCRRAPKLL